MGNTMGMRTCLELVFFCLLVQIFWQGGGNGARRAVVELLGEGVLGTACSLGSPRSRCVGVRRHRCFSRVCAGIQKVMTQIEIRKPIQDIKIAVDASACMFSIDCYILFFYLSVYFCSILLRCAYFLSPLRAALGRETETVESLARTVGRPS